MSRLPRAAQPRLTSRLGSLWVLPLSLALLAGFGCGRDTSETQGGSATPGPETTPRHVLLLTVDTLRSDHLSSLGAHGPTTPYLDTLLAGGVVFPRALAPVPRTTPSLASLLTGTYPHNHGVRTLIDPLDDTVTTLAEVFRSRGFRTVAVVSNHLLTPQRRLFRGFDIYDHADDRRDAVATTDAVFRHLEGSPRDDKLFLWVHYIDPHVPYLPTAEVRRSFVDAAYEGPYGDGFGQQPGGIGDLAYPADLPKVEAVYRNTLPDEVNEHIRHLYAGDVRATDDQISRLVEGLRTRLRNDWHIVFTADHGESLGEHDFFYDHGDYVYNPSLMVPLAFVAPPGDPSLVPRVVPTWVSLVDVMPTLMEWLDLPSVGGAGPVDGRSLMPMLRGQEMPRAPVYAESGHSFYPTEVRRRQRFDVAGRFRTVIEDDWKLIWTPGHPSPYELYDLATDPAESKDLFRPDHPRLAGLQDSLRRWFRSASEGEAKSAPSSEDIEALRSLGYLP